MSSNNMSKLIVSSLIVLLFSLILYHFYFSTNTNCPKGYFHLKGMKYCHKQLTCVDYQNMIVLKQFQQGLVKKVYLVKWNEFYIVLSQLTHQHFKDDFVHNINTLEALSPSNLIVQIIGHCNDSLLFTEYHQYSDVLNLPTLLTEQFSNMNNLKTRFNLCINYIKIIDYLHNNKLGTLVMCDSNSLEKTLSQYLITDQLKLVVNDLDASPVIRNPLIGIKCGHRQLHGTFVAPEQLWPHVNRPFNDSEMIGYDEKTDIWKVPDVCEWFLSFNQHKDVINYIKNLLRQVHSKCKRKNPKLRPTASEILTYYQMIASRIIS